MNKKYFIIYILSLFSVLSYGQVGVNTTSPQGFFHINGLNNSNEPLNKDDDFIVQGDGTDGIIVSLSGSPRKSASLSLNNPHKALTLNRIGLNSPNGDDPLNPIQNPPEGIFIYNTNHAGNYPDNVLPGPYIYKNGYWQQLRYVIDNTDMGRYIVNFTEQPINKSSSVTFNASDFLASATCLNMKKDDDNTLLTYFTLANNAAYGIALDISGTTTNSASKWALGSFFIGAVDITNSTNPVILDIVQITPIIASGTSKTSYATTLGFNGYTGAKISIFICQSNDSSKSWTLTNPSTALIWRL